MRKVILVPYSKKADIKLVKDCHLDFNNSDIAHCLGFIPDKKLVMCRVDRKYDSIYVYTDIVWGN